MKTIIVIIVIVIILYFLLRKKSREDSIEFNNKTTSDFSIGRSNTRINKLDIKNEKDGIVENNKTQEINENDEIFTDENGLKYRIVKKSREVPRRTYIKAFLNGKYWGVFDEGFSNQFAQSKFFDFNIYEVTLKNAIYGDSPFKFDQDLRIPREKLPQFLNTILEKDGKEYEVNLREPLFSVIKFNRKLHQDEGNEVFGTIDALVTGYILDFIVEQYEVKEYITSINPKPSGSTEIGEPSITEIKKPTSTQAPSTTSITDHTSSTSSGSTKPKLTKTLIATGNVEYNGNYKRIEYFYSNFINTYWGPWIYTKPANTSTHEGCLSTTIDAIGIIIGIAFILLILPQLLYFLPFILLIFLLNLIPTKIYNWFFRIIGLILLIGFLVSLFQFFSHSTNTYIPKPTVVDIPQERKTETTPIFDTINLIAINDTLIKHFRVWEDYDGEQYEGYIWTKNSDYIKAKYFKNNLNIEPFTPRAYDEMIYSLKENDKHNLGGVYQLFDSIREHKQLSNVKFAELIVSFVQDIPYAVIVPDDCNPNLYDDEFIREYLNSENAICYGFQKFGINSPVEFMSNLYGDCDTRTLLLYTMLAHYDYDVALFSSEYYGHSIIGVNLPIDGIAYKYQNQRYVLWETTTPNLKAGVLPKEISNLNYWRISLKSK